MKDCPQCNNIDVPDIADKCPFCGYEFLAKKEESINTKTVIYADKKSRGSKRVALLVIVILIFCIGVELFKNISNHTFNEYDVTEESTDVIEEELLMSENIEESFEEDLVEVETIEKLNINTEAETQIITLPVDMTCIVSVSATSSLSEYNMTHSPERVLDGDISTAWVEGVSGQGIGETITLYFDGEYLITGVNINAGYQKNFGTYEKNSRPAELKISFSDGTSQIYTLQDINEMQEILLEQAVVTEYISFAIESVYFGRKYEDTVISEIYLY